MSKPLEDRITLMLAINDLLKQEYQDFISKHPQLHKHLDNADNHLGLALLEIKKIIEKN